MIQTLVLLAGLSLGADVKDYDKAPYESAREECVKSERPLVALIGAPWCVYCKIVHKFVPRFHEKGNYTYVDLDKQKDLAHELAGSGPIPRLAVWTKADKGWVKKVYVGEEIEQFIKE